MDPSFGSKNARAGGLSTILLVAFLAIVLLIMLAGGVAP